MDLQGKKEEKRGDLDKKEYFSTKTYVFQPKTCVFQPRTNGNFIDKRIFSLETDS